MIHPKVIARHLK